MPFWTFYLKRYHQTTDSFRSLSMQMKDWVI